MNNFLKIPGHCVECFKKIESSKIICDKCQNLISNLTDLEDIKENV